MGKHSALVQRAVKELIRSGMQGHMQAGDEFAVWTYQENVRTRGFPPVPWRPEEREELAAAAAQYLKGHAYQNEPSLYGALVKMFQVVRTSRQLTVLLIHDGSQELQGTPFDAYANGVYREQNKRVFRMKRPFVTCLLAVNGEIIACQVTPIEEKTTLPEIPPDLQESLKAAASSKVTPYVSPAPQLKLVELLPAPAPIKPTLLLLPTVQVPGAEYAPSARPSTPAPASKAPGGNPETLEPRLPAPEPELSSAVKPLPPVPAAMTPVRPEVVTPAVLAEVPPPAASMPSSSVRAESESHPPATQIIESPTQAVVAAAIDGEKPLRLATAVPKVSATKKAPRTVTATATVQPLVSGNQMLLTGIAFLLVAVLLACMLSRTARSRPTPSLISQSLGTGADA
jgi:hypothetical protein